jgi:excinuclease ABC subunit C
MEIKKKLEETDEELLELAIIELRERLIVVKRNHRSFPVVDLGRT